MGESHSDYLDYMSQYSHEQLVLFADPSAGLKGAIAIHDTTLGPALGGCRMWKHKTEADALRDVLRLSRAMTYKNAAAGLNLGGGKAIIWGDPTKDKSEGLFRALGRQGGSLGGRYLTTEDVGTTERDMDYIASETRHIAGLPIADGGSGDPSAATGWGIFNAMKACAREALGSEELAGKRILILGLGKVGTYLAGHLYKAGAELLGADISDERVRHAQEKFNLTPVDLDAAFSEDCDIFAPCALGGALNSDTIPFLRASIVCGAANNQLLTEEDGDALQERSILYGPDYISNAGGVINLSFEIGRSYDKKAAFERTARIYDTMTDVIQISKREGISTARAADHLAASRIESVRRLQRVDNR